MYLNEESGIEEEEEERRPWVDDMRESERERIRGEGRWAAEKKIRG